MQQTLGHGYLRFRAGSKGWPTYLQSKSHAHTTGLLSTALLL